MIQKNLIPRAEMFGLFRMTHFVGLKWSSYHNPLLNLVLLVLVVLVHLGSDGALLRCGMLEAELRDVLSLDNDVLSEVYKYTLPANPGLVRLPPLLWSNLRMDLDQLLVENWTSGVVLLGFRYP